MIKVDLNCDIGELCDGGATDTALIPHISSANVACGFHAGGSEAMERTTKTAALYGCAVGAHPGFPDRENFGRTELVCTPSQIRGYMLYQLGALSAFCSAAGIRMSHVKPHGALYNMAARDAALARAVCEAVASFDPSLIVMGLSGSLLLRAAQDAGLAAASEVFADRGYCSDGSLVSRKLPNTVLHDMDAICERAVRMVRDGVVEAVDGTLVPVRADTICLHGDNPGSVGFAKSVRAALEAEGIVIAPVSEVVG